MNKDVFFSALIKGQASTGMAIRIPHETDRLPGDRIKELTAAVRTLQLPDGARIRTETLVAPPVEVKTEDLAKYLWADGSFNAPRLRRHLTAWISGQAPYSFIPRPGVPVLEHELFGREKLLDNLIEDIRNRRSCHLRAPRRYGKTSLLMRLAVMIPKTVLLELSDIGSLKGFLKVLLRSCLRREQARNCLLLLPSYRAWPVDASGFSAQNFNLDFSELLQKYDGGRLPALVRQTMDALADAGVILLIDEFSVFLRNMDEKPDERRTFLELFYKCRQREHRPLTTVLAGSAGLSTYIHFFKMEEFFDDLVAVDVPPIPEQEARILAEELFYGMEKRPWLEAIDCVVRLTGHDDTIPYFVHALVHVTSEEVMRKKEIAAADVERAYTDRLLGPSGNIYFRDYILRERTYPPVCRPAASDILKRLTGKFPEVVAEEALRQCCGKECEFDKLISCLEEDYDLVKTETGWRMRSRVLADRWRLGEPWLTLGGGM